MLEDLGRLNMKRRLVESVPALSVSDLGDLVAGVEAITVRTAGSEQRIAITWVATYFGGSRAYFRCPFCSSRVGILYAAPAFGCRRCHHLGYSIENQTKLWRKSAKLRKLQRRAGIDISRISRPIPPKAKGQHWHSYLNLRRKIQEADHDFAAAWMRQRHGRHLLHELTR